MMASAITRPVALVAGLVIRRNSKFLELATALVLQGLARGYSMSNIRWLISQAALESNWGTSYGAQECNNFFGMHKPSKRSTTNVGSYAAFDGLTDVEYLKYATPWQCARDRFLWDDEFYESVAPLKGSESYPDAVAARYHSSAGYGPAVYGVATANAEEIRRMTIAPLIVVPLELIILMRLLK